MTGPITRILLRYIAGALVILGFIGSDVGHMIAEDPDIAAVLQWLVAGAAAVAAEGYYWLARKFGWQT